MFDDTLREYLDNKKNWETKAKERYIKVNDKISNAYKQNKIRDIVRNTINYYKNKIFIQEKKEDEMFIFMTITINSIYNVKEHLTEYENIDIVKNQVNYINKYINNIFKNNKCEYIAVKEFTKKNNIHMHILGKIKTNELHKHIKTIYKQQQKYNEIGAIQIKLNNNTLTNDILNNVETFINKKDNVINNYYLDEKCNTANKKSGTILTLEELNENEDENVLYYILKYVKKNMEDTKYNETNQEHTLMKALNIKKMTFSNNIVHFNIDNKLIEKLIIYNHYNNIQFDKDYRYNELIALLYNIESDTKEEQDKLLESYNNYNQCELLECDTIQDKKNIILQKLDFYHDVYYIAYLDNIDEHILENYTIDEIFDLLKQCVKEIFDNEIEHRQLINAQYEDIDNYNLNDIEVVTYF